MIAPAREWKCDACQTVEVQTGPRAAEILPIPPHHWTLVDITEIEPPHTVGDGESKVKMGENRKTIRRTFCPPCSSKVAHDILVYTSSSKTPNQKVDHCNGMYCHVNEKGSLACICLCSKCVNAKKNDH